MTEGAADGLVVEVGARSVRVAVEGQGVLRCPLRGNLFKMNTDETRPVAVGDRVRVVVESEDDGVIVAVAERSNRLARRASGGRGHVGRGVHGWSEHTGAATRRQRSRRGRRVRRGRRDDTGSGRGRLRTDRSPKERPEGPPDPKRPDSPDTVAPAGPGAPDDASPAANEEAEEAVTAWEQRAEESATRSGMGAGKGGAEKRGIPRVQVLAANLDRIIVVASLDDPPFRPGLVDRFLVAADMEGIDAVLCLNKMDLAEPDVGLDESVADVYLDCDVPVYPTSTVTGAGLDAVRALMSDGVSLLVGHSGVGKSSLLNAVSPGLDLRVGHVTGYHGRGRHTTTAAVLLPLDAGGWVVDSPGLREFVLDGVSATEVARLYPGFEGLPDKCRFTDCLHQEEPGCAVIDAAMAGRLDADRYEAYLRVLEDMLQ